MPLPSSTTSLVAGGGDDLDDGRCHSRRPPILCADSGGIALVVGDVEFKDHDLTVSGGADGLGALSAESAHLGALGPGSEQRRNASLMRSPTATAHFGSESTRALMGTPRPLFPTVELAPTRFPRPDRKCIASGYPRHPLSTSPPIPPPPNPYRQAEGIPALGRLCHSKIFHGGAFDARGNYLRHASPWLKTHLLECSYVLDSVVADWLLPLTPKSFTNVVNANFRPELVSLDSKNQLILTFESDFLLQTAKFSDSPLFNTLSSYIRSLFLRSDSPAVYSKAGILRRKTVTIFEMDYGPLIGLPSRSCSKLKAGSLFTSTQDSDRAFVFRCREYLHIDCDTGLWSTFVETNAGQYTFELCSSSIPYLEYLNASQVDAALPYIESQDTETIVHLRQFIALQSLLNHFRVFKVFNWMLEGCIAIYYC
ncbi:hypothetical protein C8R43DRAFT_1141887 [Mycena crocata]|nr:hypothetical protein C8R43DRAFT_1141887 [Mycena crocata]